MMPISQLESPDVNLQLAPDAKVNRTVGRNSFVFTSVMILVLILLSLVTQITPIFSNDSYQYLSVAQNLLEGNGISTSIIHFDEQKYTGRMPAPQSVFPPGYAMLTALISLTGVPLETAALLVSLTSALAIVALMFWIGKLIQMPRWKLLFAIFTVAANSYTWRYARFVGTEAVFTATTLLSLGLLMTAETLPQNRKRTLYLLSGALVAGFACCHRYAGYFLVLTELAFYGLWLLRRRNIRALGDLFVAGFSLLPVAILLFRNRLISGGLRGTSTKPVSNSVTETLRTLVDSVFHLSFGALTGKNDFLRPGFLIIGLAVSLLGLVLLFVVTKHRTKAYDPPHEGRLSGKTILLAMYFTLYISGILYLALTTPISFGDRLLYPILPVFVLLAASFNSWNTPYSLRNHQLVPRLLLVMGGICYLGVHIQNEFRSETKTPHRDVLCELEQSGLDGTPLTDWILNHIPPETVVMSLNGQAIGYAIGRKTVSFVSNEYSTQAWTETRTLETAKKYHAEYLLVPYKHHDAEVIAKESPFVLDLINNVAPSWLVLETSNATFRIYKVQL